MSELDEIRARRMRELLAQQQHQNIEQQLKAQEIEQQIKLVLRQILSPEAQQRLANIRLARPEFARQVEILLIQLYQGGRLKALDDEQFKALLAKIKSGRRETKINVR